MLFLGKTKAPKKPRKQDHPPFELKNIDAPLQTETFSQTIQRQPGGTAGAAAIPNVSSAPH